MRLFIAIDLPDEWKAALEDMQKSIEWLGRGVKWTKPRGMHLTLKFLGDVPDEQINDVIAGLERACEGTAPFKMRMKGTGCFPSPNRPRVYWAGLNGGKLLLALQERVEQEISPLGFPREKRDFTPHLTIARIKEPIGKERITRAVLDYKLESDSIQVTEVLLLSLIHI